MIQRQQEEQMRIQQQQAEQMRIQQQQEEQMRIQQQQEEQRRIQMQQEEQMRMQQQQEEQRRIQQQQEEQMRFQRQQEEQARQSADMKRQQEEAERQRQEQIQRQEMERQQQEMLMQQQSMSQKVTSSQISSSSSTTKSGGFAVESRPEPVLSESQLAQPPMSSSSLFESSQSQSFAQQSSSIQQSSSSYSQSQTSKEVFESQELSGGVMKGYKKKEDFASNQIETGETVRDSGVFGGIGGDNNSLVDSEFDYKKHTVKDLAKHFALVKPKADIPHAILPEQRMYNGDHGPALNYLNTSKSEMGSSSSTQSFMKKEISQEDFEASKQAYEMKKKQQQMESQQSQSTSSQSTVIKRSESSVKTEQTTTVLNERRQSLVASSLMMDPAKAHAESGIIDPSAILRGSDAAGFRSKSEGILGQSTEQAETDKVLNKWDNHNAIARGWGGVKENYHPVTFRGIYNVDSQKNFTSQNL